MRSYRIVHRTEYEYSAEVTASFGHAHLVPRTLEVQRVQSTSVASDPVAGEWYEHRDFFGNTASYFAIFTTHHHLEVVSRSVVDTTRARVGAGELDDVGWEAARFTRDDDIEARGFLLASPHVPSSSLVAAYAAQSFGRGRGLGEAIVDLSTRIQRDFQYVPGATTVGTTLDEVLADRRGVCQDFAHLAVGCLRAVGLPARYVSGYLETDPPAGHPRLVGGDATHAWAEVLVPGLDWVGIDPTNNQFADERYIVAAWGRDYGDVPPLSGVIMTNAQHSTMRVSVDVARLAPDSDPAAVTAGDTDEPAREPAAQDLAGPGR